MRENVNTAGLEIADALERLVDDVRLKIHLASMDVRDAWESLEPDIRALQTALRNPPEERPRKAASPGRIALEEAGLQFHLAAMEAGERWEKIERRLGPILEHLAGAGRSVAGAMKTVEREGKRRSREAARNRRMAREELRMVREHLRMAAADGLAIVREAVERIERRFEPVNAPALPPVPPAAPM